MPPTFHPIIARWFDEKIGQPTDVQNQAWPEIIAEKHVLSNRVISGQLISQVQEKLICDSENFEILLRISRVAAVADVKPLEIKWLPLFLARFQGLTQTRNTIDGLFRCLEQLLCYPLKAGLWESEVFPSRLCEYDPAWLDSIIQEGEAIWVGQEKQRIAFCLKPELELLNDDTGYQQPDGGAHFDPTPLVSHENREEKTEIDNSALTDLFEDETARYDFSALLNKSNLKARNLAGQLWKAVWRGYITNDSFLALRLMELSGEILTGYFFSGIPGPQFISRHALRISQQALPTDTVYWINATDPVSLCGVQIEALKSRLPKRIVGTHLVYCGSKLVMVSKRYAKALEFHVPVDDPRFQEYLCSLRHLLTRNFQPLRHITIETINNVEAARSEYVNTLKTSFDVIVNYRQVVLYNKLNPN
jgi:hypothetical protein